ncbi:MAG: DUF3224 domain-containing protein [Xanthomonadales bacterium]|nr:DUF3224 domain-containing protein [Xanthomonadales bacterium]
MPQVKGEFEVKREMQPMVDMGDDAQAAHMRFDKVFHGPLDATGVVHMLAVGTAVEGSAAYVAVERIVGRLDGHAGTFYMQHSGTMDRGTPSLAVSVVPDSGTDGLIGLRGTLAIDITDGKHFYTFDYSLPA